jgi:spermidine synthase
VSVVIGDGAQYVAEAGRRFDVIIVDSTDPAGPGATLFSDRFYADCRSALRRNGLIALQSGCPFYRAGEIAQTLSRLQHRFGAARAFLAPVPTYANGLLALMIAGREDRFVPGLDVLQARTAAAGLNTKYYSPAVHHAAFAMPPRFDPRPYGGDCDEPAAVRVPEWITRPIDRRRIASRAAR